MSAPSPAPTLAPTPHHVPVHVPSSAGAVVLVTFLCLVAVLALLYIATAAVLGAKDDERWNNWGTDDESTPRPGPCSRLVCERNWRALGTCLLLPFVWLVRLVWALIDLGLNAGYEMVNQTPSVGADGSNAKVRRRGESNGGVASKGTAMVYNEIGPKQQTGMAYSVQRGQEDDEEKEHRRSQRRRAEEQKKGLGQMPMTFQRNTLPELVAEV